VSGVLSLVLRILHAVTSEASDLSEGRTDEARDTDSRSLCRLGRRRRRRLVLASADEAIRVWLHRTCLFHGSRLGVTQGRAMTEWSLE
jgi:hypothetical protein